MKKPILHIDMDGVLVDFQSGIDHFEFSSKEMKAKWKGRWDEHPSIFYHMKPMPGAVDAFKELCKYFDTYILSTAPWENPRAWMHKVDWVQRHLGEDAYKRITLSHNKHLLRGDFLIDDRLANGADRFEGTLIRFGSDEFPDWEAVMREMMTVANTKR